MLLSLYYGFLFLGTDFLGSTVTLQAPLHALAFRIHLFLEQQHLLWACSVPGICHGNSKMIKYHAELYVCPSTIVLQTTSSSVSYPHLLSYVRSKSMEKALSWSETPGWVLPLFSHLMAMRFLQYL